MLAHWSDHSAVAPWAKTAMTAVNEQGILVGDPSGTVAAARACMMPVCATARTASAA
ncbi:hypothetical protein [Paenibacillus sp. 1P07SE]|uniref:hypothetical protein n=1 Tax=Paenibacillus sp. 1P07SE TaxID=3132209 RepID=UPI0039A6F796